MQQNGLNEIEIMIIEFVSNGLNNKEIALNINETQDDVKSLLNNIYKKFGVNNRLQLAFKYYELTQKTTSLPNSPKF